MRQALLPSAGTSWAGPVAVAPASYHPCRRQPCPRGCPCGLAAGNRHLRPGRLRSHRGQQVLVAWLLAVAPCGLAVAVHARGTATTTGGCPLQGAWPQPTAPLVGGLAVAMPGCPLQGLPSL
ncbi:hypothetical protein GW17_00017984 [Ensete ventricosum]|nr:hypothetical protein GW17_00017984 [Ensete ventricosum]